MADIVKSPKRMLGHAKSHLAKLETEVRAFSSIRVLTKLNPLSLHGVIDTPWEDRRAVGLRCSYFLGVEIMATALIHRPKHVQAIGILGVEIAHMERALSDLFRAITDIHFLVAESIFFTSNSSIARMDIISNVAPLVLSQFPAKVKRINRLIERAKSAMGKRHDVIHAFWFLAEKGEDIRAEKLGAFRYKTYTLKQLEEQIENIRSLIEDISRFCAQFREDHPGPARTRQSLREYWSK
jgi:hypothetical protein